MIDELERMRKEAICPGICVDGPRKITINLRITNLLTEMNFSSKVLDCYHWTRRFNVCIYIYIGVHNVCRSLWPRGLRRELSSLARTLGSWIRFPLKA
jgi:hypothetical protein